MKTRHQTNMRQTKSLVGLSPKLWNHATDTFNIQSHLFGVAFYGLSVRMARPGKTLPSSSSREAPPPVEMWDSFGAWPDFSAALAESPPPTIDMQVLLWSASVLATAKVPCLKFSNSNTPMGPFQIAVLALDSTSQYKSWVFGPMSRAIWSAGMFSSDVTCGVISLKSGAQRWSTGKSRSTPMSLALAKSFWANAMISILPFLPVASFSHMDFPVFLPAAFKKV
mmetsp:Transcript_2051/g.3787  ORF Transcript_2051/g.3787 Transcript_2051/m.3787 type:complete len:224 (-) Transcript_2051:746-1417(-)